MHSEARRSPGPRTQRSTVSTRQVLARPVTDINGEPLGTVSEIVFEADRGMAAYVVIDCVDDSRCALPFGMLCIDADASRMCARVHRDVFLGGRSHVDPRADGPETGETLNERKHDVE